MTTCFNCGAAGPVHHHHVVPRSLGGVATVPLCHVCHGKAHGRERGFHDTNELTRAALAAKRSRGEAFNHAPYGYRAEGGRLVADEGEQAVIARMRAARSRGLTVRAIADQLAAEGVVSRKGAPLHFTTIANLLARVAIEGSAQ